MKVVIYTNCDLNKVFIAQTVNSVDHVRHFQLALMAQLNMGKSSNVEKSQKC